MIKYVVYSCFMIAWPGAPATVQEDIATPEACVRVASAYLNGHPYRNAYCVLVEKVKPK